MKTHITDRGLDIGILVSTDKVEEQYNRWLMKYLGKRALPPPQTQVPAAPMREQPPAPQPQDTPGGY